MEVSHQPVGINDSNNDSDIRFNVFLNTYIKKRTPPPKKKLADKKIMYHNSNFTFLKLKKTILNKAVDNLSTYSSLGFIILEEKSRSAVTFWGD